MAKSSTSDLIPLLILLFIIVVAAAVGFVFYQIANEVADKTAKKMEKHNVSFGSEGMKVGVKSRTAEEVGDSTQRWVSWMKIESLTTY
jgi:flagellar basal body-associated protein FliL